MSAGNAIDSPAKAVVHLFMEMRESCMNYHGFKESDSDVQCSDKRNGSDWCGFECCPRLKSSAQHNGVA